MKNLVCLLALLMSSTKLSTVNASIVAIMDSGTDLTHKDLASKTWVNIKERVGSLRDLDGDGLPGDINGWDFVNNSPKVFLDTYNNLIDSDVKKFFDYYSKFELGTLSKTSPEFLWLQSSVANKDLMNKVNFVGGYIHGTHVAGISTINNPLAKILVMKIIPTIYHDQKDIDAAAAKVDPADSAEEDNTPLASIDEFTASVVDGGSAQIKSMTALHQILNFQKVDVTNQSFGIGFNDAVGFVKSGFQKNIKRDPTNDELATIVKAYYKQLLTDGHKMFDAAPNTLFTLAAGNDTLDNDKYPDYPSSIKADNKIVVAATFGYQSLARFSNYGATLVDVAAPGVGITSTAPTNTYIALSGTSQAAPFVANVAASMKDVNPALTVRDLKAIILGTVDVKSWLQGKVSTSGIVNKARALKAAELAKTQAVDQAIANARVAIADVSIEKSLRNNMMQPTLNYHPLRPSLLIKQ